MNYRAKLKSIFRTVFTNHNEGGRASEAVSAKAGAAAEVPSRSVAPTPVVSHYREPWRPSSHEDAGFDGGIVGVNGKIICDMAMTGIEGMMQPLYLQRIIACVNACAGVSTFDLQTMQPGALTQYVQQEKFVQYCKQELAPELKSVAAALRSNSEQFFREQANRDTCINCGPSCMGGAAHNARAEDGVVYGGRL